VDDGSPSTATPESTALLPDRRLRRVRARRRNWLIIAALLLLIGGTFGLGFWLLERSRADVEAARRQLAQQAYEQGHFEDAAHQFHTLEQDYPDSPEVSDYHFLAELAFVRAPVYVSHTEVNDWLQTAQHFLAFVQEHQGEEQLKAHQGDIWDTLQQLATDLAEGAASKQNRELLTLARTVAETAESFDPPAGAAARERQQQLRKTLEQTEQRLVLHERRQELLETLRLLVSQPVGNVVRQGRELVRRFAEQQPELVQDAEVQKLLAQLPAVHRDSVVYVANRQLASPVKTPPLPSSLLLVEAHNHEGPVEGVAAVSVPFLARGVLYALDPRDGKVRWARRVGMDVAALPIALPPSPILPARWLVLSSDRNTLSAVASDTGAVLWEQPLESFCPGQPVVVGDRAFVPLLDGKVLELDTVGGTMLGSYDVGQSLAGWGVWQPEAQRLYLPADSYGVFVLDVAQKKCRHILYTEHPAGSLLGPPLLLARPAAASLLLLGQAEGLDRMRLRIFALVGDDEAPVQEVASKHLDGWLWFPPSHTAEQLALVTDTGNLHIYGLHRQGSAAEALFPRFGYQFQHRRTEKMPTWHGQVAHMDHDLFWVMFGGRLHKLHAGLFRHEGEKLLPPWLESEEVGTLLQPAELRTTEAKQHVFYLGTRSPDEQLCQASALATPYGRLRWQSKLGLVFRETPLVLGDKVLSLEPNSQTVVLDSGRWQSSDKSWYDGTDLLLPRLTGPAPLLQVLPAPGQDAACLLLGSNQGVPTRLQLRHIRLDGDQLRTQDHAFEVQRPYTGTPAVGLKALVLPLTNGILVRCPLGEGPVLAGPNWRAAHADPDAPGHVLWLNDSSFLVTDGSRGLRHIHWPEKQNWEQKESLDLSHRIAQPPVLLPATEEQKAPRVVVADADQVVTLVQSEPLKVVRRWTMPGQITAGPFVRDKYIGCIVDGRQLMWLDPDQQEPVGQYRAPARIVGEPQLIAGRLVVADQSGQLAALDPATAKVAGLPYHIPLSASPATTPVRWGQAHALVPLTDGTALFWPVPTVSE
jgi:hypothetical protein